MKQQVIAHIASAQAIGALAHLLPFARGCDTIWMRKERKKIYLLLIYHILYGVKPIMMTHSLNKSVTLPMYTLT